MSSMWRKNCWCLVLIALTIILSISAVSAVRINEVMAKPVSTYEEWVEIYNNETTNLTSSNWKIGDNSDNDTFSLNISPGEFALILDGNLNCSFFNLPNENCVEIPNIGNMLSEKDSLYLYNNNSVLISNFSWDDAKTNISWQYYNQSWQECSPTPGEENFCEPACQPNWSCGQWSDCSDGERTRSCQDLNNCSNPIDKPNETKQCTIENSSEIYLELVYENETEDEEIDIEVRSYNLKDKNYDVKVFIEENGSVISETYSEKDDEWQSSVFYIENFIHGPGNKTNTTEIRLDEENEDFIGNTTIKARIRENGEGDYIKEWSGDIEFIEDTDNPDNFSLSSTKTQKNNDDDNNIETSQKSEVISLNRGKDIKSHKPKVYKSKTQYIKEYAIYGFSLFCVIVIVTLLIKPDLLPNG